MGIAEVSCRLYLPVGKALTIGARPGLNLSETHGLIVMCLTIRLCLSHAVINRVILRAHNLFDCCYPVVLNPVCSSLIDCCYSSQDVKPSVNGIRRLLGILRPEALRLALRLNVWSQRLATIQRILKPISVQLSIAELLSHFRSLHSFWRSLFEVVAMQLSLAFILCFCLSILSFATTTLRKPRWRLFGVHGITPSCQM